MAVAARRAYVMSLLGLPLMAADECDGDVPPLGDVLADVRGTEVIPDSGLRGLPWQNRPRTSSREQARRKQKKKINIDVRKSCIYRRGAERQEGHFMCHFTWWLSKMFCQRVGSAAVGKVPKRNKSARRHRQKKVCEWSNGLSASRMLIGLHVCQKFLKNSSSMSCCCLQSCVTGSFRGCTPATCRKDAHLCCAHAVCFPSVCNLFFSPTMAPILNDAQTCAGCSLGGSACWLSAFG